MEAVKKEFPEADVRLGDEIDFLIPVKEVSPNLIVLGYDQHLPLGINKEDLGCNILKADSFEPETYKSSFIKRNKTEKDS